MEIFTHMDSLKPEFIKIANDNHLLIKGLTVDEYEYEFLEDGQESSIKVDNLLWIFEIPQINALVGLHETSCADGSAIFRCFSICGGAVFEFPIYDTGIGFVQAEDEYAFDFTFARPELSASMYMWAVLNAAGIQVKGVKSD